MWYENLFLKMEESGDSQQAEKMSAYMKNKFEFLGIPKPKRKEIEKPYLKESKKYEFDWEFVGICWGKEYREAQYVAIEYLTMNAKRLTVEDLPRLEQLITSKSWWETVDSLDALVGHIVQKDKSLEKKMLEWSVSDNIWIRRVAIDFQQGFKEKTNAELLEAIICNNFGSSEFFINKAIGWSLRDYSKVNPDWVKCFLTRYSDQLSALSKKEAGKYL